TRTSRVAVSDRWIWGLPLGASDTERDRLRASHLASISGRVAVGLVWLGLAAFPVSAAASGPSPDPSPPETTSPAAGGPAPDPAPAPTAGPSPSGPAGQKEASAAPISASSPASAPSRPAATGQPSGGSGTVATSPTATQSLSKRESVAVETPLSAVSSSHVAASTHRPRTGLTHRRTPAGGLLALVGSA